MSSFPRIMNASCAAAETEEDLHRLESRVDALVTKTCTLEGIPTGKRLFHHDGIGAVNNYQMANRGFEYYRRLSFKKPYIISVSGSKSDLQKMLSAETTATMFEINISCPNAQHAQLADLQKLKMSRPYGVKLPPMLTLESLAATARVLTSLTPSPRYVVCSNTYAGIVAGQAGGVSGRYLMPIALANVTMMRKLLPAGIAVVGCGGISTADDARTYIKNGANAVQIATELVLNGPAIFDTLQSAQLWRGKL